MVQVSAQGATLRPGPPPQARGAPRGSPRWFYRELSTSRCARAGPVGSSEGWRASGGPLPAEGDRAALERGRRGASRGVAAREARRTLEGTGGPSEDTHRGTAELVKDLSGRVGEGAWGGLAPRLLQKEHYSGRQKLPCASTQHITHASTHTGHIRTPKHIHEHTSHSFNVETVHTDRMS